MTTKVKKTAELLGFISYSAGAVDLTWSLFQSAVDDYKCESLLRPFPPQFIGPDGEKQIEKLRTNAAKVKSIADINSQLQGSNIDEELLDLMHWVLIKAPTFTFHVLPKSEFLDVMSKVHSTKPGAALPDFIFAVDHSRKQRNKKFEDLAEKSGSIFAFHGSKLPHFQSILHHGLQVSLNKVAAFGPGIYLSKQLDVSFNYSPAGFGWNGSQMGKSISVVALCEMIDHPDVKFRDEKMESRKFTEGSNGSQVPNHYFVVQNSDMVRVNYLLVYAPQRPSAVLATAEIRKKLRRKVMVICFVAYLLMMFFIGFFNSSYYYKVKWTVNNWWNPQDNNIIYNNL